MGNLSITQNTKQKTQMWYEEWLDFFLQPPFYTEHEKNEIYKYFKQICEALEQGDSCIELENDVDMLHPITQVLSKEPDVYKPLVWDKPYLYLQRYWSLESKLARQVFHLAQATIEQHDLSKYQAIFEDPYQQQALNMGVNSAFAMITGGPGTGKTYILTRIVAILKKVYPEMRIAMAAPTGKAAQRMQEALQQAFQSDELQALGLYHPDFDYQQTQTIHRLLGMGQQQIAKYHQKHPLPYDVVVIDEASMLDLNLAQQLFDAIRPPTRLILLGDAQQLSSVDIGYVLADLHRVPALKLHQVMLRKSRRFSDDAMIGQFARYIYNTKEISLSNWLSIMQPYDLLSQGLPQIKEQSLAEQNIAKDWIGYYAFTSNMHVAQYQAIYQQLALGYQPYIDALKRYNNEQIDLKQLSQIFDEYRILVVMRYFELGLDAINDALTLYIREQLNQVSAGEWFLGRPVMMTYNDYQLGLSNGDIGICIYDKQQTRQYVVYFPSLNKTISAARLPQSIQTAFALTIHKSQGSEFKHVAVVLDERADTLLSKELLYTAITRAKKMVSLYCSAQAFEKTLRYTTQRKSGLSQQINRLFNAE